MSSHFDHNDKRFVSFVGVCSNKEHSFALVFDFMDHLNLNKYLKNNRVFGGGGG